MKQANHEAPRDHVIEDADGLLLRVARVVEGEVHSDWTDSLDSAWRCSSSSLVAERIARAVGGRVVPAHFGEDPA